MRKGGRTVAGMENEIKNKKIRKELKLFLFVDDMIDTQRILKVPPGNFYRC